MAAGPERSELRAFDGQEVAAEIERENTRWLVVWGAYSREFSAFCLFPGMERSMLVSRDPDTLRWAIHEVERRAHRKNHGKQGESDGV
jgi:hypothetical protein